LMTRTLAAWFGFTVAALAQPGGPIHIHPTNVDFREGDAGAIPPGWVVPQQGIDSGYSVELRREDCPERFSACVLFRSPAHVTSVRDAVLGQTFTALPYIGKTVRFGAWLRAQGAGADVELRVRVDHVDRRVEFFDSVEGPVDAAQAQWREVVGRVGADAKTISIWARFHPSGAAWVLEPSFGILPDGRDPQDETSVRALIRKFADLRNAHDGKAVAELYTEDGEWAGPNGEGGVRGREDLAGLWGNVPGQVERTIQSVEFPGGNLALVRVTVQYPEPIGRHHEAFIAVKENGAWFIRIHRSVD